MSNHDVSTLILLFQEGVYPYEYMHETWSTYETSLPAKEDFYIHLNMEDINAADYAHAKRVYIDFEKKLRGYDDLYIQSDILLLAYVFENFWNMRLEIYGVDPARFLNAPGLAWQAALKKSKLNLHFLTDIDMLSMVEAGVRGGIYHAIHRYAKANSKCIKDHDKNKESSYLKYWNINKLYRSIMLPLWKLPINDFKWIEEKSQPNKDFIKSYNDDSDEGYFLEADVQYSDNLHNLHNNLFF